MRPRTRRRQPSLAKPRESATHLDDSGTPGYTVAYGREETQFPVYVAGFLGAALIAGGFVRGSVIMFTLGAAFTAFAYYNFPLVETGRPRLGANQYGIFIEGLGLIRWRSLQGIELIPLATRNLIMHELHLDLREPINVALVTDWRRQPLYRRGMRLIWKMGPGNVVRLTLDPLELPPDEIHRALQRMWRYYRS